MGCCLFRIGWELWFRRSYFATRVCKLLLSIFSLTCFQTALQMTFTPLSRNRILFSCPGPLLAPILTLPKPKLMKWSYLSIIPFWNSLPRILLLVPAYPLRVKLLFPGKALPNCCSAGVSDPVSYLPQCFLWAVLSVFFLSPFTLFSVFCMAHVHARNIQKQYSVIIPSAPNH